MRRLAVPAIISLQSERRGNDHSGEWRLLPGGADPVVTVLLQEGDICYTTPACTFPTACRETHTCPTCPWSGSLGGEGGDPHLPPPAGIAISFIHLLPPSLLFSHLPISYISAYSFSIIHFQTCIHVKHYLYSVSIPLPQPFIIPVLPLFSISRVCVCVAVRAVALLRPGSISSSLARPSADRAVIAFASSLTGTGETFWQWQTKRNY